MCFGDFLGKGTLCYAYHKEYASYKAACLVISGLIIEFSGLRKDSKADVSSVSPSSERLWVACGLYTERWSYAIGWYVVT